MPRRTFPSALILAVTVAWFATATVVIGGEVSETREDGSVRLRYATDDKGDRHGGYVEFHENGKVKLRCVYRHGRLHGAYQTFDEKGRKVVVATYKDGKLNGNWTERDERGDPVVSAEYVDGKKQGTYEVFAGGQPVSVQHWEGGEPIDVDGVRPYGKQKDAIREAVETIFNSSDPLEKAAGDPLASQRGDCLRLLKIYRYLCDVPYEDLALTELNDQHADAGAKLCERIGHLDHTPANPGLPEDEYKFAYQGTSRSNLYQGDGMPGSVPAYMDDSDPSNIDRVGHRRWCLNPTMVKTGFGASGRFAAMWAHDGSRKDVPDFDYVAYPAAGYMPLYYFGPRHAWSVSLNPKKFDKPEPGAVKVRIIPVGDDFVRREAPLPLDHMGVSSEGMGLRDCIIFRPKELELEDGKRYWVEIDGLTKGGKPVPVRYVVHFFEL